MWHKPTQWLLLLPLSHSLSHVVLHSPLCFHHYHQTTSRKSGTGEQKNSQQLDERVFYHDWIWVKFGLLSLSFSSALAMCSCCFLGLDLTIYNCLCLCIQPTLHASLYEAFWSEHLCSHRVGALANGKVAGLFQECFKPLTLYWNCSLIHLPAKPVFFSALRRCKTI